MSLLLLTTLKLLEIEVCRATSSSTYRTHLSVDDCVLLRALSPVEFCPWHIMMQYEVWLVIRRART